jgi:protein archease
VACEVFSSDIRLIIHSMTVDHCGYREIEHTADWELEVWASDTGGLLEQAARGMYALSGVCLEQTQVEQRELELQAEDAESLLVVFLGELLHFIEQDNLAFDDFQIELDGYALRAHLTGSRVHKIDKEIKAVTYHNLQVRQTGLGLYVNIVFDV